MLRTHLLRKPVVAAVAIACGALLAPAVTAPANALPPCCGIDQDTRYYATADMTGPVVGENYDGGDCAPSYSWGQVTAYYKTRRIYCATNP